MYRIKGKFAKKGIINKYNAVSTKKKGTSNEKELDEHHYAKATNVSGASAAVSSSSHFRADPLPDVGMVSHEEVLSTCTVKDGNWSDGRFIIELGTLAQGLKGCQQCGQPLQLHNTIMHKTTGLAVSLDVFCPLCNCTSTVQCSKKHGQVYDVNTKASTAILHAGIGVAQFNSVLMCLNIPTVHYSMMKRRFRETGEAIEVVARESMEHAIQEETSEEREIEVSVDGGWQKRGSGKSYESLSGHCTMIGCKSGKVLGYSVRSKQCRVCDSAEQKGIAPEVHDCRRNFTGSAKSMEPDMVVEMVKEMKNMGIKTKAIVGDDDAASINKLRQKVDKMILKRSDKNHIRKSVSSLLYALRNKHKSLSVSVIRYILKLFGYVLSQNVGNPDGIAQGIKALGSHPFGDHSQCQTWCKKINDPSKPYRSLPFGKPLSSGQLQCDLQQIFDAYLKHSVKLSNLGSTQANESLNKTIASKAPKSMHFSGSANLNFRVAAAVSQKNAGRKYITSVHRKIGISPGTHSFRLLALQDLQFRKRKAIANSHTAKRRKLELKSKRSQRRFTQEVKEGPQYHPNLQNLADVSFDSIPDGLVIGSELCQEGPHTKIFFDLETTGLGRKSHIIQIAATSESEQFNVYVRPKVNITSKASQITGLSTENGELLLNGQSVKSYAIGDALKIFCTFLQITDNNILFAHNCKSFDSQVITNALISCNLFDTFSCSVHGFVDTLHVFKKVCPGLDSYKQISLAQHFLKSDYDAHNALSDVCTLKSIFETTKIECVNYISASFTTNYCLKKYKFSCNVDKHFASLEPLIKKKVLTSATARKIAGSDLCFQHLTLAYQRDGFNGVKSILSETIDNFVRVTKSVKIIQSIVDYISEDV